MATAMLKGLPNLLINGRLLSFKKSKRNSNKKSKGVGKIKATENSEESSSSKASTTRSGPQIRVNGAPAATPPTSAKPLKATSLVGNLFRKPSWFSFIEWCLRGYEAQWTCSRVDQWTLCNDRFPHNGLIRAFRKSHVSHTSRPTQIPRCIHRSYYFSCVIGADCQGSKKWRIW